MSDKVRSAVGVAEEVLAFRKEHGTLIRFHERAMVLDNGERGSAQKAVMFNSNDLSSLLRDMTALRAENSDLRALLLEARSRNPECYRSLSDDSGTHGAATGGELLPSPSSDSTRVAPSGEGSGQPTIREGWCPHCGVTRIEDYSGVARNEADVRGASRGQAIGCFKSPFRYQSGYVFDANNRMVADMPWSAVCRVRGWGRLQYRTDCDPEALQDMVGILIAEALTRLWDEEAPKGGGA